MRPGPSNARSVPSFLPWVAQLYRLSNFALGLENWPKLPQRAVSRAASSTGPHRGEIRLKAGQTHAPSPSIYCVVAWIPTQTLLFWRLLSGRFKFNHLIGKRVPEAEIVHYFKELVTPGKEECRTAPGGRQFKPHSRWCATHGHPRGLDVVVDTTTLVRHKSG